MIKYNIYFRRASKKRPIKVSLSEAQYKWLFYEIEKHLEDIDRLKKEIKRCKEQINWVKKAKANGGTVKL